MKREFPPKATSSCPETVPPTGDELFAEAQDSHAENSADISEEINETYDFSADIDDEWFQRDLTHQPSPVKTMHLSPGVAVKDLYTGEARSSDMRKYAGQMSRQEYLAFMGLELPDVPEEASTVVETRTDLQQSNRVQDIRSQFQARVGCTS